MRWKKGSSGRGFIESDLAEYSISGLCKLLLESENLDEALVIETSIRRIISDSNVTELRCLIESEDTYDINAANRILIDSGKVHGLSKIYRYIDPLFERNDLIISGICMSLIGDFNYFTEQSCQRVRELISVPDEFIQRYIMIWLLGRPIAELHIFISSSNNLPQSIYSIINNIKLVKLEIIGVADFLTRVHHIDDIAFREFSRISTLHSYSRKRFFPNPNSS